MTEIKQTEESPQAVPVERPAETASPAEPANSPVERVTEKKAKGPKNVALPPGKNEATQHNLTGQTPGSVASACLDGSR